MRRLPAGRTADEALVRLFDQLPEGAQADVRLKEHRWGTMRFANSWIHQPHLETQTSLSLRVALDRRLGISTTTDLSKAGLDRVAREAVAIARIAPVERRFSGFPPDGARVRTASFSASTAGMGPEAQAAFAGRVLSAAESTCPGARISGVVNIGSERLRVRNSAGLDRSTVRSIVQSSVLVERPDHDPPVSGWSEGAEWDIRKLNPARLGREAGERVAADSPIAYPPGRYRVVLRGSAVAEMLGYLGHMGFGGYAFEQGWSCLRGKTGRRIAPSFVHLVDDGMDEASLPQAIDYEGVAKRRTPLIDRGIAGGAVTDLVTAARLRRRTSSGHALPPEAPWGEWGPQPSHQLLAPGGATEEELVRETRRGILVTRFWYVRVVQPGRSIITGMTRDGTYRIEGGEIVGPIRNLRFTESVLGTLARTELLGRDWERYADERGLSTVTCPAIRVNGFRFTSATLF